MLDGWIGVYVRFVISLGEGKGTGAIGWKSA